MVTKKRKTKKTKAATRPARVLISRPSARRQNGDELSNATDYGRTVAGFAGRVKRAISAFNW